VRLQPEQSKEKEIVRTLVQQPFHTRFGSSDPKPRSNDQPDAPPTPTRRLNTPRESSRVSSKKKANHRIDVPLDRARFRTDRRADRARSHDGPATRAVSQSESRRADR
jgi:hypothetical protein